MSTKILNFNDVRAGDRVTFMRPNGLKLVRGRAVPEYAKASGIAQRYLVQAAPGVIVVNTGGRYGTPATVTPKNFVSATRPDGAA